MSIVMYVKPDCPYCQRARDHYNENGIEFIEYDAQNDKARQKEMLEYYGRRRDRSGIVENGVYISQAGAIRPAAERSTLISRQFGRLLNSKM